jgi:polyhydroxybutyrate depolymerase
MAEGIPAYIGKASITPHSIVASAAGITSEDLATMACPSIPAVLIVHSRADERFPDFGRGAAAYWGRCAACAPENLNALADGCRDFSGCTEGRRVTYCETSLPHKRWPSMNTAMLDFIQAVRPRRHRAWRALRVTERTEFCGGWRRRDLVIGRRHHVDIETGGG